jgi:hypothetical protein
LDRLLEDTGNAKMHSELASKNVSNALHSKANEDETEIEQKTDAENAGKKRKFCVISKFFQISPNFSKLLKFTQISSNWQTFLETNFAELDQRLRDVARANALMTENYKILTVLPDANQAERGESQQNEG